MTPLTPTKLGRYEILDEIGKGAMGVVYLARDPLIGRMVALKTFRIAYSVREVEMEQFRARFLREAQSAGILSHPNIVTIHDVVEESADGLAFIAMEYVQGTNLKMVLQREGALDLAFVSTVLEQVAEAVDYAHSKRVVHRDIKPANIIITAENRVKITDFGIARLDTSNLTQEGQLLGTPNYMAPEQILGHEVDHRADLFSLGVVLYEMLTRHKPFQGENLTVVSHRIVYDQFTPPRQYARQLAPEVEAILQRALEKDPARRYQRAREMADDLRRVAAPHLPVSVAVDSLNETQDLSSTSMVLPLTPPPPLPAVDTTLSSGGAFGSGTATPPPFPTLPMFPGVQIPDGTGTGVPLAPVPAAPGAGAPSPARSWQERLGVPPARLANLAFFTALICLVFGTVALLTLRPFETLPADLVQPDRRSDVLRLIDQGHQRLRAGDWSGAIAAYGQAETLAPELPGPKRMRAAAIQEAAVHSDRVARAQALGGHLERARLAMMTRRFDEAEASARAALAVDGVNAEARQILATAAAERKRPPERQAAVRRPQIALPTPQPSVQPPLPAPAPAPVEQADPAKTQLVVDFYTDLPAGDIVLFIDGRQVRREPFNFYERRGFRREASGGRVQLPPIRVSPGSVQVRLLVAPKGTSAEVWTATVSFEAGQQHRLTARLDRQGNLSVQP
ncbi:MAG TPA: serine/threonine-protein kinase [Thermoanaerobaculia bacterium]|nr:serine/threonine-protein kinase [Thermoanaerobaculia bacterium]